MPSNKWILVFSIGHSPWQSKPLELVAYGCIALEKPQDIANRQGLTCITESHLCLENRARCCDERGTNKLDEGA